MKDFRNMINLIAVINIFGVIAAYQRWVQKEKASPFERKIAIEKLKLNLTSLQNRTVQRIVRKKFTFIDFDNKMMKNSKEKFTFFVVKSEKEFIDTILRRQKLEPLAFDPKREANENDESYKEEVEKMIGKLKVVFQVL